MIGRLYYLISAIIVLVSGFIFISPALITPDLIYPVRIDSTYLAYQSTRINNSDSIMLTPSDIGLNYSDISLVSNDGFPLNGWNIIAADTPANTILIIHDLNESKILYIDHIRQFYDRGFNVSIMDLRAHGNSGGTEFTPGLPSVDDVKLMIDSVMKKPGRKNLVLMGVGLGAAIALQAAVYDDRCSGLILQSPINTYETYLERSARIRWGVMTKLWYPVLKRRAESLLRYPLKELDLREIAAYVTIPTIFIIGSDDEKVFTSETLQVFDASAAGKKELFLVRDAGHENIAKAGGETYYNRIASFLNTSLPKEIKTSRYKKLALNDN